MYKAKKIFCFIVLAFFLMSILPLSAAARTIVSADYINSNFDNDSWDGWVASGSEAPQITAVADKTPGKSILLPHQQTSAADNSTITKTFDPAAAPLPSGKVVFEANIKLVDGQPDTNSAKFTQRQFFDLSGGTNNPAAFSLIKISGSSSNSGGYIRDFTGSNAMLKYAQNTWYHIKIVVDFSTTDQPVQYYIDDKLITKTTSGTSLPVKLAKANLSNFKVAKMYSLANTNDTAQTYIDDIKIYQIQEVDYELPEVSATFPQDGSADVSEDAAIGITFNNPLKAGMFSTDHIKITGGSASIASITPNAGNTGCTIKLTQSLDFNTAYTVRLQGIEDVYKQVMPDKSFSFTTKAGYLKAVAYDFYKDSINDAAKITLTGLSSGNIYSTVSMFNYSPQDSTVTLVMGLYQDNSMEDIISSPMQTIKRGEGQILNANLPVNLPDGAGAASYYIKLFIWDSIYGLRPVSEKVIFR